MLTYAGLNDRVNRLANGLARRGLQRGDRVCLLSKNRGDYLELILAAAKLGVILACQNWRQITTELRPCIGLVSPKCTAARF